MHCVRSRNRKTGKEMVGMGSKREEGDVVSVNVIFEIKPSGGEERNRG